MPRGAASPRSSTAGSRTFSAKTVNIQVNLLHDVLKGAVADELIPSNPVTGVERPKVKRNRWRILQPARGAGRLEGVLRREGAQGVPDASC